MTRWMRTELNARIVRKLTESGERLHRNPPELEATLFTRSPQPTEEFILVEDSLHAQGFEHLLQEARVQAARGNETFAEALRMMGEGR
jgi:hypothetical protein